MTLAAPFSRTNPAKDAYQQAVAAAHQKLSKSIVDPTHIRTPVSESWRRSLEFHDTPATITEPATLASDALADHQKSHPIAAALPMLETLLAPAPDVGLITAISNTAGHLLWVNGARRTRAQAEVIGFAPGADWSEASMGTSAPGAALSTGTIAQVAGAEHFSASVQQFYCSAIPLRHPSGGILGMLDLTGSATAISPLAMALLRNTAKAVETFWATHTFPTAGPGLHEAPQPSVPSGPLIEVAAGQPARLGELRLSNRHAEILTILDWHRSGLSAAQLAAQLFGEVPPQDQRARLTTVRAEISRLRKHLAHTPHPIGLKSQPYRLDTSVTTDAKAAMTALHRGDLTAALQFAPAEILPASEAPGIAEIRRHLTYTLREAVLADANPEQLWMYLRHGQAAHDVEAWLLALKILPPTSPRRAVVIATLQRLAH